MIRRFSVLAGVLAAAAAGIAVWAGANLALGVPAAVTAVGLASLLLVESIPRSLGRGETGPAVRPTGEADRIRTAFGTGRVGRERIVSLLDAYERSGPNPAYAGHRPEEVARLVALPGHEFRAYVRSRLDDLEARS